MMEHQAVLTLMNVQMVIPINVKLERAMLVSVRTLPMVTYAFAHLVTSLIWIKMNGMLQHLVCTTKLVLRSMSVLQMIMTVISMPLAAILMAVIIAHVILDILLLQVVMLWGKDDYRNVDECPEFMELMALMSQSIHVILMPQALMTLALTLVLVILVSMTLMIMVEHVKTSMNATSPLTMSIMSHVIMEMNVSTTMVSYLVNVSPV